MASNGLAHQVVSRVLRRLLLSCVLVQNILLALSQAQITLDGSLGPRRALDGPNYRVDAELGQTRGSNLFCSFGQFNVRMRESATFSGPPAIDGQLRSDIRGPICSCSIPAGCCLARMRA
jgi:large exoprotein involved in heme utilization and adhesion